MKQEPLNTSFFEGLGKAYFEKTHSQILAWIFSKECRAIKENDKERLVKEIFGLGNIEKIENSVTEINHIDIVIETTNSVIAIENKIKSAIHSNQLKKYEAFCEKEFKRKHQREYFFLTLTEQKSNSEPWRDISYKQLYSKIQNNISEENFDSIILKEYLNYLFKLIGHYEKFIDNTRDFKFVFTDGSKTKKDKLNIKYENDECRFIASNQLETIFQIGYLSEIANKIEKKNIVGESKGTAYLDIYINENIDGKFQTILQLQGGTVKFSIRSLDYPKKNQAKALIIQKHLQFFKDLVKNDLPQFKINLPKRKGKEKVSNTPYLSVSRVLKKDYWNLSKEELLENIKNEIITAEKINENLLKYGVFKTQT